MAVLSILQEPDERLRKVSSKVLEINDETRTILDDMAETMYASNGIGLAAPQVNIHKRLVVMDVPGRGAQSSLTYLINPEIIWKSEEQTSCQEGCLSVPDFKAPIYRAKEVRVRFITPQGTEQEQLFTDLEAVCIQHEIDHLEGILFIDYLSSLKRNLFHRKLTRVRRK